MSNFPVSPTKANLEAAVSVIDQPIFEAKSLKMSEFNKLKSTKETRCKGLRDPKIKFNYRCAINCSSADFLIENPSFEN